MKNYCYARVSTTDKGQETLRQHFVVEKTGVEINEYFEEMVSGTKAAKKRPVFEKMLTKVQEGDTIYFESMSRLGRSTIDLIDTVNYLSKEKKVNLVFIKENINLTASGEGFDAVGTLFFNIMAALAQFERDLTSTRVKETLAAKKAAGKVLGRPSLEIDDEVKSYIIEHYAEETGEQLMIRTGLKKNTLYKVIKQLASDGLIKLKGGK